MTQSILGRGRSFSDRAANLTDDLHGGWIFPDLFGAFADLIGDSPNFSGIRHIDQNSISNPAGQAGHLGTEGGEIDRYDAPRWPKCHLKIVCREKFPLEVELLPAHGGLDNFDVLANPSERLIQYLPVPIRNSRIG